LEFLKISNYAKFSHFVLDLYERLKATILEKPSASVADVDPDPACHFDADPDPDPTFHLMRIRILASKSRLKTLKRFSNRFIFHTFWLAICKLMRILPFSFYCGSGSATLPQPLRIH
jgi:hypothetical protein